jgi:hypothetical protein
LVWDNDAHAGRTGLNLGGNRKYLVRCLAIRRKGELDYELDDTAKFIRWIIASLCLGIPIFRPDVFKSPA